jgi:hypothetical protein
LKRLDVLIAGGLVGAAVLGTVSAGLLWHSGRLDTLDWTLSPAVFNPWSLAAGTILLVIAVLTAGASFGGLARQYSGNSVLAGLGALSLLLACLGALGASTLDFALIAKAQGQGSAVDYIFFIQRWDWWHTLGLGLFLLAGCIGLVALGIGTARGNRHLRLPALALAAAGALSLVLPAAGAPALALTMTWLGIALVVRRSPRTSPNPVAQ